MERTPVHQAALDAIASGASVIPIRGNGSKGTTLRAWKEFQAIRADAATVDWWFNGHPDRGLAIVQGRISGSLECLDFDSHAVYAAWREAALVAGLGALVDRVEAGYLERTPNGMHIFWTCDEIAGATKLAKQVIDGRSKAVIETRGEGNYVIVAPSGGTVHESGRPYEIIRGGIASVERISPAERRELLTLARTFDECGISIGVEEGVKRDRIEPPATIPGQGRPGDDWASQASWSEILIPHGWRSVGERDGKVFWCRPGKERGISATSNYAGSGYLYVFSTSTEFESNRGYGKFGAFALLEHGGDYEAASRDLRSQGFGGDEPAPIVEAPGVDISAIVNSMGRLGFGSGSSEAVEDLPDAPTIPEPEDLGTKIPRDLLRVPGLVGQIFEYILVGSLHPQPELALAGAILTAGTLMGRKVQSPTLLRTNIYAVGLARSGFGKEDVLGGMRRIFASVERRELAAVEDVTSDAAIFHALSKNPAQVFLLDEIGKLLPKWENMGMGIATMIIKLHSRARDHLPAKAYAKPRKGEDGPPKDIVWPNLSLFGLSVPHAFWEALTSGHVNDGFLNRILLFQAPKKRPPFVEVTEKKLRVPQALRDRCNEWIKAGAITNAFSAAVTNAPLKPNMITIDYGTGTRELFDAHRDRCHAKQDELDNKRRHSEAQLYSRLPAHAIQLALIRAAGRLGPMYGTIDPEDADWGIRLANFCIAQMRQSVARYVGDDVHHRDTLRVLEIVRECGGAATRTQLTKSTRWKRKRMAEVLETLCDSRVLEEQMVKGKTKPTRVYVARGE